MPALNSLSKESGDHNSQYDESDSSILKYDFCKGPKLPYVKTIKTNAPKVHSK